MPRKRIKDGRLPIGIGQLDKKYINGIPKGSVIAIIGSAKGAVSQFLAQMASVRRTRYITTEKPRSVVEREAKITSSEYSSEKAVPDDLSVHEVYQSDKQFGDFVRETIADIGTEENLVIDNMSDFSNLTSGKDEYYALMRDIYNATTSQDGITFIYLIGEGYHSLTDAEEEIVNMCDGVFEFKNEAIGQDIKTQLHIQRLREVEDLDRKVFRLKTGGRIFVGSGQEIK